MASNDQSQRRPKLDSVPTEASQVREKEVTATGGGSDAAMYPRAAAAVGGENRRAQVLIRAQSALEQAIVPEHLTALLRLAILRRDVSLARGVLEQLEAGDKPTR